MKAFARALSLFLLALPLGGCLSGVEKADISDAALKANIEAALQDQADLNLKYVTIDVNDRVVTVSGLVGNFAEKQTIGRIIRGTRGVEHLLLNVVTQE